MIDLKKNTLHREIPDNLLVDERVLNLAKSLQPSLDKMLEWADKINYTINLEQLDDEILDHLLWEKHITWNEGLALVATKAHKISLIQNSIELHRLKGTPAALELIFSILDVDCAIQEWFKYDGDPYTFKLNLNVSETGLTEDLYNMLYALIMEYKNVRSWLDAIQIYLTSKSTSYIGVALYGGEAISVYPLMPEDIEVRTPVTVGAVPPTEHSIMTVFPQ